MQKSLKACVQFVGQAVHAYEKSWTFFSLQKDAEFLQVK